MIVYGSSGTTSSVLTFMLQEETREKWVKNVFGEIIIEKFPNLRKETDIWVQEAWGTAVRTAVIRKQEITHVGEDVEKREPQCTDSGNVSCYSNGGKQYGGSLKN